MTESEFLALLRPLATHPAARGLMDDAAVLTVPTTGDIVLTHDMIAEGVHFRAGDAPEDVAWKLVAVNLSDLAGKGATPLGVLLGYPMGDEGWDRAFVAGLEKVLAKFETPLLGGDTIACRGPRVLSLTAIGSTASAPARSGARAGDALYVTGTIGRAGRGLAGDLDHLAAYLRPFPRLAEGRALAPVAHAMMDVSDGLLVDAARIAAASSLSLVIDLDCVPVAGDVMAAVTAGDDYELLFALPPGSQPPVEATRIGVFAPGSGLSIERGDVPVPLPARLGYLHGDRSQTLA